MSTQPSGRSAVTGREHPEPPRRERSPAARSKGLDVRDPAIQVLVAVAVRKGRRVLVMREEDEPHRKAWVLPQGYPKPGETLADGARREVYEELGLDVEIDGLVGVYEEFVHPASAPVVHEVTVCYAGRLLRDVPPRPSREAVDFAWVDPARIPAGAMPWIQAILQDLARPGTRRPP